MSLSNCLLSLATNDTGLYGTTGTKKIRIRVSNSYGETYEAIRTIFASDNLCIYYVKATPTNEPITDTTLINQLDLLEKAYAYQNQTNISQSNNDKPFVIDAETVYDLSNLVTRVAILETE